MLSEYKIEKSKAALCLAAKMSKQYYGKPLIVTYSGGKDSDVMLHLAMDCLKPDDFEVMNSHTTVDAPETVYHIREVFKNLNEQGIKAEIRMPTYKGKPVTMWTLIPQKSMPPTRLVRYCCAVLKEATTSNRFIALGVRRDESSGRRGRDMFGVMGGSSKDAQFWSLEHADEVYEESQTRDEIWDCQLITSAKQNKDLIVNPIYEWSHSDIWEYIRRHDIKTNPLYEHGFDRVGCVGCPLGGRKNMIREFSLYPKHKRAYIRAFQSLIDKRIADGKECKWKTGQEVFDWWIGTDQIKGQLNLFGEDDGQDH